MDAPEKTVMVLAPNGDQLENTTQLKAERLIAKGRAVCIEESTSETVRIRLLSLSMDSRTIPVEDRSDVGLPKLKPLTPTQRMRIVDRLLRRDGTKCFYCFSEMPQDDRTLEHMLAVGKGGSHNVDNLVLAHERCNTYAGKLSIILKVKIREKHLLKHSGLDH